MKQKGLFSSALIAALGGFLFGFDTAVISGATDRLKDIFELSSFALGFTVASAIIGTVTGAIFSGKPADKFGRRNTLFVLALLYLISAFGSALAWDWYSFLTFRLIGGLGVGASSVVAPMYIAEISPASIRGRLVALTQFNIVFGMLIAYFSNYFISTFDLGMMDWRWMLGVEAIPAAIFFMLLFTIPFSPRWLISQGRTDEAIAVLKKVGTDHDDIQSEVSEIKSSLDSKNQGTQEPFFNRKYFKPISLAVMIAIFNQLSGINAVLYYAPHIFKMAGAGEGSSLLQSVAIGGTFTIFTLAALLVIDKFGRKNLMIVGSVGYIVSLGVTAWAFYTYGTDFDEMGSVVVLVSLLVFIASHAFGQGTVIWVFISEIFPNRVRARGQALGSFTHWFMTALISWTFPVIAEISGGHTFAFYALCMVGQLLWVLFVMPETKGVTLEQIQKRMGIE
jgi:SP family xylose:H+ symportor-like MFS transporter